MNEIEARVTDVKLAEDQKVKAVEFMKKLDVYAPYITGFKKDDNVCFFENFGGFWVYQEPEIEKKMREIEKEHGCKVYAITHEKTELGEMWDFLIVTAYRNEWDQLLQKNGRTFYAFAYTWNKTYDDCSEFGDIVLQSFGGGIRRIG